MPVHPGQRLTITGGPTLDQLKDAFFEPGQTVPFQTDQGEVVVRLDQLVDAGFKVRFALEGKATLATQKKDFHITGQYDTQSQSGHLFRPQLR